MHVNSRRHATAQKKSTTALPIRVRAIPPHIGPGRQEAANARRITSKSAAHVSLRKPAKALKRPIIALQIRAHATPPHIGLGQQETVHAQPGMYKSATPASLRRPAIATKPTTKPRIHVSAIMINTLLGQPVHAPANTAMS